MKIDDIKLSRGRQTIGGAPDGIEAYFLGQLAPRARSVIFVARDETHMDAAAAALRFFSSETEILRFPAWDCLPYDRVSPHNDVVAQRIDTLVNLNRADKTPPAGRVILTTVAALLQKVPPRTVFRDSVLEGRTGATLAPDTLTAFLEKNGYGRAEMVMEPGEYAVRGGIIDIYPPGVGNPLRLDFFGDELDSIRSFDAETQRTLEKIESFVLKPMSELFLDDESIERFRKGYRAHFGAVTDEDPLYASVSGGHRHAGMEHWLPLFHEQMESLFDYAPDAVVVTDQEADAAAEARVELINEYYQARQETTGLIADAEPYKPLPPEALYLPEGWQDHLAGRVVLALTPFRADAALADAINLGARPGRDFAEERANPEINVYDSLVNHVQGLQKQGVRPILAVFGKGAGERLEKLYREHGGTGTRWLDHWKDARAMGEGEVGLAVLPLDQGFEAADIALITERDVLGDRLVRRGRRGRRAENFLKEASALAEGDLVVHMDHGIGRYDGLETLQVAAAPHDCLRVLYADNDKLYVPVENIEVLSRYGQGEEAVRLDKLGGVAWQHRKAKLKERIREMADQLINVAVQRELKQGDTIAPHDGAYDEFSARFPYAETDDQHRAIDDVLKDLKSGRPMDRLVCGDVGFGKTEVALRAAFLAAMEGMQVAVVVPTTLLCRQHYETFRTRFKGFPVRIGQLSRLGSTAQNNAVRDELAKGTLDIVIGTHALLGKSVKFKNLGLLIVDEEQHFGVAHKERLKELKANVHVLTLTATPIPRTLQQALTGVREMSIIATPPVDRMAVRTFVMPFDPVVVREAIKREKFRGGQAFYVCPRIQDLSEVAREVKELVPEVSVGLAHGRMNSTELEAVMEAFYDGAHDVLISTNIIESGLDLPNVNTLIVHRSDMFGLAQLYQLRGRVGRSKIRAYAYLTIPARRKLSKASQQRLEVMQTLDSLGAGFTLASHDLDIRGAGNLLGAEQSGHIKEVGVELYQRMLEEAVAQAKSGEGLSQIDSEWSPQIDIGVPVLIPERYVADLNVRLGLYRRLSQLVGPEEMEAFAAELIDRFGSLPREVENLLETVSIKHLCKDAGIEKVEAGPKGAVVRFRHDRFANPEGLVMFLNEQAGTAKLRPDHTLVYKRIWATPEDRLKGVGQLARQLAAVAGTKGAAATGAEATG